MKKCLLAITLCLSAFYTYAQITTDPNTGNVGIRTTTPDYALTVNGNLKVINSNNLLSYNGAADIVFKYQPRGSGGRALVHSDNNTLAINYGGDFTGGTLIGSNTYFTENTNGNSYIQFGKVGIGTVSPAYKFDVSGNGRFTNGIYINDGAVLGVVSSAGYSWANNTMLQKGYDATRGDYIELLVPGGAPGQALYPANITMQANGYVGIGTHHPDQNLTVNGMIHASGVKVDTNIPVPDYVFDANYKVMPISKLKLFVKDNHHLPEIPDAAEQKKEGVDLGEMNNKLLKKVEELTLYLFEQDKKIKALEASNKVFKKGIKKLNKLLNERLTKN